MSKRKVLMSPYARFPKEKLELRDYLAIDRTVLSIDRTMLAYLHAALALVALGASAIKVFDSRVLQGFGWGFLVAGVLTLVFGIARVREMRGRIREAVGGKELPSPPEPQQETRPAQEKKPPAEPPPLSKPAPQVSPSAPDQARTP
ncbi:MAG: DUF202 domain-containing protein [Phycisphaerales bacterium]|nr:DUF202 domain-containing protein [Phycisphaerales bacterium]